MLAISPVAGVFTLSNIFSVRDLSFFFWSRHLWLRHTMFSGVFPSWDPYVAGGQSTIADALNQVWMPITVAIRLDRRQLVPRAIAPLPSFRSVPSPSGRLVVLEGGSVGRTPACTKGRRSTDRAQAA